MMDLEAIGHLKSAILGFRGLGIPKALA